MSIDGKWDVTVNSPMGVQKSVLTLKTEGGKLTGTNAGQMGSLEVKNGKVDGNRLTWTMDMTKPFAIELEVEATVNGDTIEGSIKAGGFGSSPMKGTRQA